MRAWPCGRAATARAAALINGTAAHAAEVDDSFRDAMYHPGAATIAAALAAAQATRASGADFLRAVVVGYEVSTRIGVVMGRPHYKFWHNTGTMGSFGAAAAAGSLLRLDEAAFAHALALAATFTAGLQQAFRSEAMAKPLHAGRAAEAGVLAAQLAAQGMRSSLDVLEGESGLGQAMSDGPDWSKVGATLGDDFHITRLTFKNHIGCGHTFAAIDGALALQQQHGFAHGDIESVHLGVYQPTLDIAPHVDPQTADQARFSLHYMVASALVHGSVRLSAFEPARLDDAGHARADEAHHQGAGPRGRCRLPRPPLGARRDRAARRPPLRAPAARPQGRPRTAAVRCRPGGQAARAGLSRDRRARGARAAGAHLGTTNQ